jgi:two-component system, LuxR family, response regulator FixJ
MSEQPPVVYIVDDDPATRRIFDAVLSEVGLTTCSVESAAGFLQIHDPAQPGCLLLDVQMPGMTGPELQQRLNFCGAVIPVIFVSAHADITTAVRAMTHGAFDFLQKPLSHEVLLERVRTALSFDAQNRAVLQERDDIVRRFNSLTARERDVLSLLISGSSNKAMAADLRLSQRTVELYRARVMEKTRSRSLAQLIRMAINMDFTPSSPVSSPSP